MKNNKVMLITGAASGLGKALAEEAMATHQLVLADRQVDSGQQVVDALCAQGGQAVFIPCDVTDAQQITQLASQVKETFGQLDVLINNAGVASQGDLSDSSDAEWSRLINTNLLSVVRVTRACLPLLKKSKSACIVNVASFAALALMPGMSSYNVVKAGVLALSETLRGELANDGIHVVCACPAFFETNLVTSMDGVDDQVKSRIQSWMRSSKYTANDVANLILVAIKKHQFLVLADRKSLWQYRIMRWFPAYFYRQKLSFYGKFKK